MAHTRGIRFPPTVSRNGQRRKVEGVAVALGAEAALGEVPRQLVDDLVWGHAVHRDSSAPEAAGVAGGGLGVGGDVAHM